MAKKKPKGKTKKPTKCKIEISTLLINALVDLIVGTLLILIAKIIE